MTDLEFYQGRCAGPTVGDLVHAVLGIDNPEDAKRFFLGYTEQVQKMIENGTWKGSPNASRAASRNIGFCFGEGMSRERIAMWKAATPAYHSWGIA